MYGQRRKGSSEQDDLQNASSANRARLRSSSTPAPAGPTSGTSSRLCRTEPHSREVSTIEHSISPPSSLVGDHLLDRRGSRHERALGALRLQTSPSSRRTRAQMGIYVLAPPDIVFESTECWTAAAAATNVLSEPFACNPHRAHVARVKMGIHTPIQDTTPPCTFLRSA